MAGPVYASVYEIVRRIPRGKVVTYGQISALLGGRLSAQGVGWALKALPSSDSQYSSANVPWQRVVNAAGLTSTHKNPNIPPGLQRVILESEGVKFKQDESIDMGRFLWLEIATCLDKPSKKSPEGNKAPKLKRRSSKTAPKAKKHRAR